MDKKYLEWIRTHVHFDQPALEATLEDYLHEVEHVAQRITKFEKAIDEAIGNAAPEIRAVVQALQALRGVAQTTAATSVSELGCVSRFESPRQLMGYSGLVRVSTQVASESCEVRLQKRAMLTSDEYSSKQPGRTSTAQRDRLSAVQTEITRPER